MPCIFFSKSRIVTIQSRGHPRHVIYDVNYFQSLPIRIASQSLCCVCCWDASGLITLRLDSSSLRWSRRTPRMTSRQAEEDEAEKDEAEEVIGEKTRRRWGHLWQAVYWCETSTRIKDLLKITELSAAKGHEGRQPGQIKSHVWPIRVVEEWRHSFHVSVSEQVLPSSDGCLLKQWVWESTWQLWVRVHVR